MLGSRMAGFITRSDGEFYPDMLPFIAQFTIQMIDPLSKWIGKGALMV